MVWKKKPKKEATPEEAPTSSVQEATEETPEQEAREPTVEEVRLRELATSFVREYDGAVVHGTDAVRANLLMAIYGEQRRTNELLEALLEKVGEE